MPLRQQHESLMLLELLLTGPWGPPHSSSHFPQPRAGRAGHQFTAPHALIPQIFKPVASPLSQARVSSPVPKSYQETAVPGVRSACSIHTGRNRLHMTLIFFCEVSIQGAKLQGPSFPREHPTPSNTPRVAPGSELNPTPATPHSVVSWEMDWSP